MATFNENDVIRIVLDVAGKNDVPTDTPGIKKKKLINNLDYNDNLMSVLQVALDDYVKTINPAAAVSDDDLGGCETVQDVIDVVEKALS